MKDWLFSIGRRLKAIIHKRFWKIREINRRYAVPRIKTNKAVSLSLLALRLYLLLLVALLFYKFYTLIV